MMLVAWTSRCRSARPSTSVLVERVLAEALDASTSNRRRCRTSGKTWAETSPGCTAGACNEALARREALADPRELVEEGGSDA